MSTKTFTAKISSIQTTDSGISYTLDVLESFERKDEALVAQVIIAPEGEVMACQSVSFENVNEEHLGKFKETFEESLYDLFMFYFDGEEYEFYEHEGFSYVIEEEMKSAVTCFDFEVDCEE